MAERTASPADRPTEWTTAVVGIVTAVVAFRTNHDVAGFVASVGAFMPAVVTFITELLHKTPAP